MDRLPEALVLEILSRPDDTADVARSRLAWKTFNAVSPGLRSINLQWRLQKYLESRPGVSSSSSSSQFTSPLKRVIRNLVSNSRVLESVRISAGNLPIDASNADHFGDDMYITDVGFVSEWLPRISGDLKSLSISDFLVQSSLLEMDPHVPKIKELKQERKIKMVGARKRQTPYWREN